MTTKEQKKRLGIFLVIALAAFIIVLGVLVIPGLTERGELYYINFKETSVYGVYIGSEVKYQGVTIGRVVEIRVNPQDLDSVLVYVRIEREFPVKEDMEAVLMYMGITGQKYVDLSGGTIESASLSPGDEIPSSRGIGEKAEDIVANIDLALNNINSVLGKDNQRKISLFLENAEKTSEILSSVLEQRQENLSNAITNLERAALEFGAVTENLEEITSDLGTLTAALEESAEQALNNLAQRFSDEEMGRIIGNMDTFIVSASESMDILEQVLLRQQREIQELFKGVSQAMENLTRFTRELAEDPTLLIRSRREKKK
jgi:phospholipid/cholesterol/gamma-HCH transport system substrate-binding protein